jgi:hypothetical protein
MTASAPVKNQFVWREQFGAIVLLTNVDGLAGRLRGVTRSGARRT